MLETTRGFSPLAPMVAELLARAESQQIVDLCSGGAGPYLHLQPRVEAVLGKPVRVVLTDLYPNTIAFRRAAAICPNIAFCPEPVDARAVPPELQGVRTLFDGLHHFRPSEARAVLSDAVRAGAPIFAAEAAERSPRALLATLLIPPLVLLLMPRVHPRSLTALLLTYGVPVVPFVVFWDGVVSCLRSYRPTELEALVRELDEFAWEAGTVKQHGLNLTYLAGFAKGGAQPTKPRG